MPRTFVITYFYDESDGNPMWIGSNDDLPVAAEGRSYEEMVKHVWEQATEMAVENGHVQDAASIHLLFMADMAAPTVYAAAE